MKPCGHTIGQTPFDCGGRGENVFGAGRLAKQQLGDDTHSFDFTMFPGKENR